MATDYGHQADQEGQTLSFEQRLGPVKRVDRLAFLIDRAKGKRILHLGCADEHLVDLKLQNSAHLHGQLLKVAKELWGVDVSSEGLSQLRRAGFTNLVHGDVERLDAVTELRNQRFDLIIAGEVIEHLSNPGLFLKGCLSLCSPETELVLTTPNALAYTQPIFACLDREAVHPDHTLSWSPAILTALLKRNGFAIKEFWVYGGIPCVQLHHKEPIGRKLARLALRCADEVMRHTVVRFRPWLNNGLIVVVKSESSHRT
jgi:2-polyprenyl-3-methyl-5-hydroxy-6-metoxy-1,4-benzoquinol methylase